MNAILSILVCFAMLFSGGAALPAQPEAATTWTLRNLTIATSDGSVTLSPEARLTAAIGSEAALVQFEVVNGDDVLLPMAGELTQDSVRFRLRDGGSVYSLSNDALLELMEFDDAGAQLMAQMVDYLNSYSALLSRTMGDASFQQELSQTMIDLLVSACGGAVEQVAVEIDGAEVPAERVELEITPESALDLLDGLASCGVTEVEDMLNSYMQLLTSATGEDYASLSDFTAEQRALLAEEDAISVPMELTWTAEGPGYLEAAMDFAIDDTSAVQLSFSETSTEEKTSLDMILSFAIDDGMGSTNCMDFYMTEQVDGPLNAPEKVQLSLVASSQNDWESEYEDEGVAHSFVSSSAMNLALDVNAAVVDGLEHATIDLTASQSSSYDYDGDVNSDESGLSAHISSDDRSEADGSVTSAVAMDVEADGENVQVSWELNRAEGMPVPSFDASKTVELRPGSDDEQSTSDMLNLMSDAISVTSDALALSEDESVAAMMELLDIDVDPYSLMVEDEYAPVTVDSLEEAAEIYAGALPAFTLPEDLALDTIEVNESCLYAYYSSADGDRNIDLNCFDSYYTGGEFYAFQNGQLIPTDASVQINIQDVENTVFNASVYFPNGTYFFYFDGFAQEEVEAVLASLQY